MAATGPAQKSTVIIHPVSESEQMNMEHHLREERREELLMLGGVSHR